MEPNKKEPPMTNLRIMEKLDRGTRKYAMAVNAKYSAETLMQHEGKPFGLVFTTVPTEWLVGGNTDVAKRLVTANLGNAFGESMCVKIATTSPNSKRPTGQVSLKISKLSKEGAKRLAKGYVRAGEDGNKIRRGIAVHKEHDLRAQSFDMPENDNSTIMRGAWPLPLHSTHTHTQTRSPSSGESSPRDGRCGKVSRVVGAGDKHWATRDELLQMILAAVKKELAKDEHKDQQVDAKSGKLQLDKGISLPEYWRLWTAKVGMWVYPDVLPAVTHDSEGVPHRSHEGRKEVREWSMKTPYAWRIRHPHAMYELMRDVASTVAQGITEATVRRLHDEVLLLLSASSHTVCWCQSLSAAVTHCMPLSPTACCCHSLSATAGAPWMLLSPTVSCYHSLPASQAGMRLEYGTFFS